LLLFSPVLCETLLYNSDPFHPTRAVNAVRTTLPVPKKTVLLQQADQFKGVAHRKLLSQFPEGFLNGRKTDHVDQLVPGEIMKFTAQGALFIFFNQNDLFCRRYQV
jgi:hypothetical protein